MTKGRCRPFVKTVHCHASYLTASFSALPENKCRHVSCGDFDFFTGLRVAGQYAQRGGSLEGTETNQLYSIAFFQRLSNSSQGRFQSSFSLHFRQISLVRKLHQSVESCS